jgi:carbon-monoxide dehydrogenase medium subunit
MHSLKPLDYFDPENVQKASEILSGQGEKAWILAGGIDLIPRIRNRTLEADHVINIQKIPGMDAIEFIPDKGLTFGAHACWSNSSTGPPMK